jgi:putative ABC transport system ATP-binding protein
VNGSGSRSPVPWSATGVVVTHDAQLASWADRVVHTRDGRIAEQTVPAPGPGSLLGQDR